jgi:hypothetical protein
VPSLKFYISHFLLSPLADALRRKLILHYQRAALLFAAFPAFVINRHVKRGAHFEINPLPIFLVKEVAFYVVPKLFHNFKIEKRRSVFT